MPEYELLKGVKHFKDHAYEENKDLYTELINGQSPENIVIACSDSRVIPTDITNTKAGDIFPGRNPGNIVAPYSDLPSGGAATIEFGLLHLKAKQIIVIGHSHCGAMDGLRNPDLGKTYPATDRWLSFSKPILHQFQERHPELLEHPELELACLAQDNVLLQIEHLKTHPSVQEKLRAGELVIHGWYYDFGKGEVYIYNKRQNKFISFDDSVTEYTRHRMDLLLTEELSKYETDYSSIKTAPLYTQHLSALKLHHGDALWTQIKEAVSQKLLSAVRELYGMKDGSINPQFTSLVERDLEAARTSSLRKLQGALMSSPGNQLFCTQSRITIFSELLNEVPGKSEEQAPVLEGSAPH